MLATLGASATPASATPPHLQLVEQAGEITEATSLVSDPSAPNRLYVTQRDGNVFTLEDNEANLLVDLSSLVAARVPHGEEALSSMVLAPDFAQSRHFYVDYPSKAEPENIRIEELTASGDPATVFASRRLVIAIPHGSTAHHFGGQLQFGPDGYLYISTGDGFPAPPYPTSSPAQDLGNLLGKLLRIDPDDPDGAGALTYSVPLDNPFVGQLGAQPEIWSSGFRNPFRFSFDRASGDLLIGDVGQDKAEEIDFAASPASGVVGGRGENYGWPCMEGFDPYGGTVDPPGCPASPPTFTPPRFAYLHDVPEGGCAIIGGYVVHDPTLGDLDGRYLYGDFCGSELRSLLDSSSRLEPNLALEGAFELESFGEDACGRVYVLAANVYRIEGDAPASCGLLKVAVSGSGSVAGPKIDCPASCTGYFTVSDPLVGAALTPTPAPGWSFAGWQGDCTGTGPCAPVVDRERGVTAVFAPPPPDTGDKSEPEKTATPSGPTQGIGEPGKIPTAIGLGAFELDKHRGRGSLTVSVPGPGTIVLSARGIAKVRRQVAAGRVKLAVVPIGKRRRALARKGKLEVTVKVVFTPVAGEPSSRLRKLTLRKIAR